MDQLIEWLPKNIPDSAKDESLVGIVHGDYRLDNLMFHPTEARVLAVLDWELSTLGHPLADFSYHCMAWHISPGTFRGIGGLDLASLGIPSESEYIRRYCERTGFTTPDALAKDWNFYLAYNMPNASKTARPRASKPKHRARVPNPWPSWPGVLPAKPELFLPPEPQPQEKDHGF
jgi:aminoglycoside phosphotransferase (APT) family kinase protein